MTSSSSNVFVAGCLSSRVQIIGTNHVVCCGKPRFHDQPGYVFSAWRSGKRAFVGVVAIQNGTTRESLVTATGNQSSYENPIRKSDSFVGICKISIIYHYLIINAPKCLITFNVFVCPGAYAAHSKCNPNPNPKVNCTSICCYQNTETS